MAIYAWCDIGNCFQCHQLLRYETHLVPVVVVCRVVCLRVCHCARRTRGTVIYTLPLGVRFLGAAHV